MPTLAQISLTALAAFVPWAFSMPISIAAGLWFAASWSFLYLLFQWLPFLRRLVPIDKIIGQIILLILFWTIMSIPLTVAYNKEQAAKLLGCLYVKRSFLSWIFLKKEAYSPIPVHFGAGHGGLLWGGIRGQPLINFVDSFLIIDRDDYGDPIVSTIVRDKDGNIAIKMDKNCWETTTRSVVWDKNYTSDTIEVLGNEGHNLFRLHIDHSGITIQGIWYGIDPEDRNKIRRFRKDISGLLPDDNTLFLYPSGSHWGEYDPRFRDAYADD